MTNTNSPKPLLSVIVPCYNVAKFLPESLGALLTQNFADIEIICVNDGSPDATGQILEDYARRDARIIVIHKENGGVSSARNAGLAVARAEYITFHDPDDKVMPEIYTKTLPVIISDHGIDMVWFDWYHVIVYQDNSHTYLRDRDNDKRLSSGKYVLNYAIWKTITNNVWDKIFKTSIIKEHGIRFSEALRIGEDIDFIWKYMVHICSFYYLRDPLLFYFVHKGHVSLTIKIYQEDALTVALQPLFLLEGFAEYLCGKNLLDKHKGFIADRLSFEKYMKGNKSSLRHEYFKKARQIAVQYDLPNTPDNFIKKLKSGTRNPAGLYFWVRRIFVKKKDAKQAIFYLFGCKILSVPIRWLERQ